MVRLAWIGMVLAAVVAGAGCGSAEPPGGGGAAGGGGGQDGITFLPLSVGATWTLRITDPMKGQSDKTATVEALEEMGGKKAGVTAFRIREDEPTKVTMTWQEVRGNAVIRHLDRTLELSGAMRSEESYSPSKLRIDESRERTVQGARWTDNFVETKLENGQTATQAKGARWAVEAVAETVTVPAGTFACLRLRRTSETGASDKTYWFARGVGKVKEVGDQLEELASFRIP